MLFSGETMENVDNRNRGSRKKGDGLYNTLRNFRINQPVTISTFTCIKK